MCINFRELMNRIYVEREITLKFFKGEGLKTIKDHFEKAVNDIIEKKITVLNDNHDWKIVVVIDNLFKLYIKVGVRDKISPTVELFEEFEILDKWYEKVTNEDEEENI